VAPLDVQMPHVTRAEVIEQVAHQIVLARHTFVLVTGQYGQTMSQHFVRLVHQLAIPVVTKSFSIPKLLAGLRGAAGRLP
jgi:hypothetical protein